MGKFGKQRGGAERGGEMKKYVVTLYEGGFRLVDEDMTNDETENFVQANLDDNCDYARLSVTFDGKEAAADFLAFLIPSCSIDAMPCNHIMTISWCAADEWDCDEEGELEATTGMWARAYYPAYKA